MPVNTVNPYVNPQNADDLRKMMDDQRSSKGQQVNTANLQAQNQNAVMTPQAVGQAVRVDISNQAKQAAGSDKSNETKKENGSGPGKASSGKNTQTGARNVNIIA